ncbi:MAG TPA: glycoside hydrolase family 6 protein [Oligoflexus sp.]|uniref:glycoside hydrolase family 6 protein n=1 Tax=Oligoflexus sp. TaxID=1971216 RepID=UPI002D67F523|nr:glycoside hydrolase family 6 protein [Oligoflexus sp.]HYX34916.1 glycoside hydrolase family 6 protein [Oligoflexus sp.]
MLMRSALFNLGILAFLLSCKTTENQRGEHDNPKKNTPDTGRGTVDNLPAPIGPDAVKTPAPVFAWDPTKATDPYLPAHGSVIPESNPFFGVRLLVNPLFTQAVDFSASKSPAMADTIKKYRDKPTALWLDTIGRVASLEPALKLAVEQQTKTEDKVLVTLVIYNLPNRDCFANASNGELNKTELSRYRTEYIDRIKEILARYPTVPVVAIIEPDSLPNLITNLGKLRCDTETPALYKGGISYAVQSLQLPHVSLYIDLAHAGWLGWAFNDDGADKRSSLVTIMREVIGTARVRGFVTNVANYTSLREPANSTRPESYYQFNKIHDEYTYVSALAGQLKAEQLPTSFIIDTSRNGNVKARTDWSNWCNIKDTGLGALPTIAPRPDVDAFLWIKPPGESDGVSDANAERYDARCQSMDSLRGAPQAGQWFHEHFLGLVQNAQTTLP